MTKSRNNIDLYLRLAGMTQADLAKQIGATETSISRYINGHRIPNALIAIDIADALNCSVEDLYSLKRKEE